MSSENAETEDVQAFQHKVDSSDDVVVSENLVVEISSEHGDVYCSIKPVSLMTFPRRRLPAMYGQSLPFVSASIDRTRADVPPI